MNLNNFGSSAMPSHPAGRSRPEDHKQPAAAIQWKISQVGIYRACGLTRKQLPAGAYFGVADFHKPIQIRKKDLQVDDLIDIPNGLPSKVLKEIEEFWSLGMKFQQLGYLHRRGYFFYGPQGSGKSSIVHQIIKQIINAGHVAFFCDDPSTLVKTMQLFRQVEPNRPVVCVFEDIDAIIQNHGDSEILQWLDGYHQIDKVVNIATTNYPEVLDRRIVSRPRRFDRMIKLEAIPEEARRTYLAKKLPHLDASELDEWVEKTEGMSFAALAEVVISVACLGKTLDETVELLRTLEGHRLSSKEYDEPAFMGFAPKPNGKKTKGRK